MPRSLPLVCVLAIAGCADEQASAGPIAGSQIVTADTSGCLSSMERFAVDTTGRVDCVATQVFGTDNVDGATRCEDLGSTFCTPGRAPCRGTTSFPPVSLEQAVHKTPYPVMFESPSGTFERTSTEKITIVGDSAFAIDPVGRRHLICEMAPMPTANLGACATDPSFDGASSSGWCYTTAPAVVQTCTTRSGVRTFGEARPRPRAFIVLTCPATFE